MQQKGFWKFSRRVYRILIVVSAVVVVVSILTIYLFGNIDLSERFGVKPDSEIIDMAEDDFNRIENGVHVRTGLIEAEGLMAVVNNCTNCHSAQLVTQNRMNGARWKATIRWMQETQNLWELGENEEIIVNYLVNNYPPQKKGRREPLQDIEWYELKE